MYRSRNPWGDAFHLQVCTILRSVFFIYLRMQYVSSLSIKHLSCPIHARWQSWRQHVVNKARTFPHPRFSPIPRDKPTVDFHAKSMFLLFLIIAVSGLGDNHARSRFYITRDTNHGTSPTLSIVYPTIVSEESSLHTPSLVSGIERVNLGLITGLRFHLEWWWRWHGRMKRVDNRKWHMAFFLPRCA